VTPDALVCPRCARTYPTDERFCAVCGMPLVAGWAGAEPSEAARRARKIKPQYAEGSLVRVVGASNQTEAEFIQGMLLEEGVPSTLRRTRGFDVPDMLAAGPRDVMVPASGHAAAREVLLQAELVGDDEPGTPPSQVLAFLLVAVAVVALIAWIGTDLLG
jgi:RNA polymerase subunit RPABC4/transcription elongation factor Spt4